MLKGGKGGGGRGEEEGRERGEGERGAQKFPDPDSFSNMLRQVRRKWLSMHALIIHCTKTKPEDRPPMTDILEQLDKMPEFSYNY